MALRFAAVFCFVSWISAFLLAKEDYGAYISYLAAQENVKELAVHEVSRPNDILAYFLVGVTKKMRLKGFSELAATTRAACTMLSRQTSVGGVSVMVWKQLTTRCKYVKYEHTPTRRKRPRARAGASEAKRRRPLAAWFCRFNGKM